ncbi:MAG: tetratricopeptide repeat protein, partial [Myxococcota bacterium]
DAFARRRPFSAKDLQRILQEGRVQAHLAHPFILPVFDVIEISGYPALLMPYIDGPSLHQLLRAYTPTRDESLALLRCITEGLWYAHQHNLVHRDLKPANVLLDLRHGRLRPRIADFGLVKVGEDATTQPGAMLGTPAYAAPEQLFDADSANARADLFSLGVMFVELLTRHRPSSGTQPPSWSLDEVEDEGLRALIAALLQPDPRHRPASCQAVLEQLGAVPRKALLAGSRLVQAVERSRSRRSAEQQTAQSELSGTNAPETLPNNVPRRHNEFLGRDKELNTLQRQLTEGHRLITILGAGGVGKSRLSVELGRRLLGGPDEWPGGIWFIELAEIRAVHGIITAVAGALGIKLGTDPEAQLLRALVARPKTLLILDNFEQISQFAPQTVGRWLDQAENTQFLITSREPLRLRGERSHTVDVLDEADAIALFHVRAERVAPGFNLDSDHRDSVRALVHLLDRLPLAIELAAGRSPGFSPEMLVSRMSRRFMLLQSRSPQRPERQQTLRATLIWSWELLSAAEQSALAQCSVFEGGFSLEAAEAVIELDDDNCEDVIAELASKSLLTLRHGGPHQAVRLSMLLSVQQFVREQMHVMHPVEARHGQYFSRFGSPAAISALSLSATNRPHQALLAERDNLLAATHRAIARDDAIVAAQCALAAAEIYHQRGPILAGARLLEQVARSVTLPPLLNTRVQRTTGQLFLLTRYHANAAVCFQDALVAARAAGDREQEAMCLTQQASLSRVQGHLPQAEAHCLRALTIAREIGARMAEAHVLAQQGILCRHQGHMEDARTLLEAATEIAAEQGARKAGAGWMTILGQLDYDQGRLDDAQRWYEHALSIIRQLDNPGMESAASGHFSSLLRQQGRLEQAEDLLHDALRIAREIGNQRLEGYHLGRLGMLHFEQHRYEEAQQAYQVALTIAQQREERGEESLQHGRLGRLYHQQGRVEPAIAHYRAALEIAHQLNNRVGECNWLGNLGNLYFSINRYEEAEAVFLKAIAIARQTGDRGREGMWLGNLSNLY